MSVLHDLVAQIEDDSLRCRIAKELDRLAKQKKFGLVFEEHLPECTPLYDIPVKVGALVAKKTGHVNDVYKVLKIHENVAECLHREGKEVVDIEVAELVTVAEFGEPIYPYLKPLDSISNNPDSDLWHILIEADNYHALQLLEYLYAGKVDCIYIDPPYNTGARDWKYNNDYVDGSDAYRHSKWLSFMQKRLKLAKRLLNPNDSVLIITIDEKEYLHLGCLLEELFPAENIQMVSAMTNKKGSTRPGQFSRAGEYIFFVYIGNCVLSQSKDNMLLPNDIEEDSASNESSVTIWNSLLRRGTAALRSDRPNLFYPIYVDRNSQEIVYVGESLPLTEARENVQVPEGLPSSVVACWPMRKNDIEGRWQVGQSTLKKRIDEHRVKAGQFNKATQQFSIVMLKDKQMEQIEEGLLKVTGIDATGAFIVEETDTRHTSTQSPRSIWVRDSHDASVYGSTLLRGILADRKFPFPKSLYAVQDTLRFFVKEKPSALILDFFAGSGTTMHAVNLLNAEDGGQRRCIMVTNNEVSVDEAKVLTDRGYTVGDENWESYGIAHYITWPRTVCSINGCDVSGSPLKGSYLGSNLPMASGFNANAAFFKLGFLDRHSVALGRQFKEMLPTLWMKAGAIGPCPDVDSVALPNMLVLPQNKLAILIDDRAYMEFIAELGKYPEIKTVFIVTDSDAGYRDMISGLEDKNTYQLYRDYLDNFRINSIRR